MAAAPPIPGPIRCTSLPTIDMAQKRHVFFALNGVTGAGKTTFASLASGRKHLKIGKGDRSCRNSLLIMVKLSVPDGAANPHAGTHRPQEATFRFEGQVVTLIDTPGFQDPERDDEDVLEHIAKYLAERYGNGLLLDGLILFHPANSRDTMRRATEKDLTEIVQRILGKNVYDRVAIASTKWDKVSNQARAVHEEDRRKQPGGVWHSMCSQGAVVFRHDNTKPSADTILRFLASRPNRPFPVLMQEELVSHNGHLASTSAGQEMNRRLDEQIMWAEQTRQSARLGRADRSLKRVRQLEKQLEDLTNRRSKFDQIKVRSTRPATHEAYY